MAMAEPERRRRRPAVSCALCRRRKIRCNREIPCSNCVRSKSGTCVYQQHPPLQPPRQRFGQTIEPTLAEEVASSTSASTPPSQPYTSDVESLKGRISQLEEQLLKATQTSTHSPTPAPSSNIETADPRLGVYSYAHHESRLFGQIQIISRGITHKSRLFGKSHWTNGVTMFFDIFELMDPHIREETSKAFSGIRRCKYLAKVIKEARAPQWPSPPTSDLPPKDVADKLVDCYLRTTETVYRVLHVPSFRKDYEALWVLDKEPDVAFLVQLKLVLAIGAATYDKQFSLRSSAVKWVYEAQTWASEPEFKSRLSMQFLQINILLLLARETAAVGQGSIWISAGALLRTAMHMGLHRDPKFLPKRTILAAEMRRRLWNTILEINLQSSMTSGGPPLVSLNDFDTEPPSNFDDDQLLTEDPMPKLENSFTQMSIAIALHKTFALRLTVTEFLNDLGSQSTYEETLRLDAELKASHKVLCKALQGSRSKKTGWSPPQFGLCMVDFIIHRYISAIHVPFFGQALHEAAYAYSRKVAVETSLKLWCAAYPSSSIIQSRSDTTSSDHAEFSRLVACGSMFFRTVAIQACFIMAAEIKTQLQDEEGLSSVPLRADLLSVLEDCKAWCLQSIEAGETNMKGYLFISLVSAHIGGLMQGLQKEELPEVLIKAAEEAVETCLPILEDKAAQSQPEGTVDGLNQMLSNTPLIGDWDFMLDSQFDLSNADPTSWMFNSDATQDLSLW